MVESICLLVERDVQMTPEQMVAVLPIGDEAELLNEDTMSLLYLVYSASEADVSDYKVKVLDLFSFVKNDVISDPRFASFLDDVMVAMVDEGESMIAEGLAQLVGPEHSRLIVTINYVFESPEITAFYNNLYKTLDELFAEDYYIVGNSAMSHEVSKTFNDEYLFISILTALAVFLVVAVTFRKFSVPLLLICIIECAVFTMMGAMALSGTDIYFIAVIIVQCILMGSLIDYGILFSNYYCEVREELPVEKALPEVLKRSISAIATSSVILVIVTLVCGSFMTGAVGTILTALGIGSFASLLLVVFVLPSLLAIFDDVIVKHKKVEVAELSENS
jgi:predicted RND superfamily exporter protein